jgi:FKBP-type peptidyl-prolyl cis-trans isomerase
MAMQAGEQERFFMFCISRHFQYYCHRGSLITPGAVLVFDLELLRVG